MRPVYMQAQNTNTCYEFRYRLQYMPHASHNSHQVIGLWLMECLSLILVMHEITVIYYISSLVINVVKWNFEERAASVSISHTAQITLLVVELSTKYNHYSTKFVGLRKECIGNCKHEKWCALCGILCSVGL